MPAGPWLNNAIWVTIAGYLYFRGTKTASRNCKIMSSRSRTGVSDETVQDLTKLGPVSIKDPRILLSSLVVSSCAWLGPFCSEGWKWALLMLSLGAFLSPLTLPSIDIKYEDLKRPFRLFAKWGVSKLDKYFKQLLIGLVIFRFLRLPWLGRIVSSYASQCFPIMEGSGSRIFEEVAGAGAIILIQMLLLRLSQLFVNGTVLCVLWLCSVSFLWMSLQFEADEVLKAKPLELATLALLLTTTGIDFLDDVLEAVIENVGEKEKVSDEE